MSNFLITIVVICRLLDAVLYWGIGTAGIAFVVYSAIALDSRCFELGVLALCLQHLYAIYRKMRESDV